MYLILTMYHVLNHISLGNVYERDMICIRFVKDDCFDMTFAVCYNI